MNTYIGLDVFCYCLKKQILYNSSEASNAAHVAQCTWTDDEYNENVNAKIDMCGAAIQDG